ncbi:MAG: hypothetical protein AAF602_01555 [Myxococcota bacterium]
MSMTIQGWWPVVWLGGCSGSLADPADPATAAPSLEPPPARPDDPVRRMLLEEVLPDKTLRQHMVTHFSSATDAVWFLSLDELGTMRAMVAPVAHADPDDLPEELRPLLPAMTDAAEAWARAPDRRTAARASATLAARCAACHLRWGKVRPLTDTALDFPLLPEALSHGVSPYVLWLGLVLPSDEAWTLGAAQMVTPPERPATRALNDDYAALAERAEEATGEARHEVWTEAVAGCATCHLAADVQLVDATPRGLVREPE